ncbi:hypothetical protein ASPWEDRAFT_51551 [Aspergillus wentii DTO 134E9]|uniref:Uncharacterized protein n=1 Tax=Aspergillus wentii DTO 134E9 TaxID=1073089 RepID=A0A1L9RKW0_ASPWE|nr:uncharacterized protein ASPWEDRAFT_51551 [Aspergillus wentii DTO 134E9]KAI9924712.1 hypothetical protein MW887_006564 [Aspergillus wentii]OJJ35523.1 hypothetical protein ASPWEDRAFT_51551 [Aspergillus wentii DTO 134E9]
MAPIRRYLRISKYSVLECRIYLENPSDTRWLLDSRDPVLKRIFTCIRPLILPKLREENERLFSKKKGKPVKDVIAEDEFEVAIFLRDSRTRHSLLTRQKTFQGAGEGSGENKQGGSAGTAEAGILVESDDDSGPGLDEIPQAGAEENETNAKRQRQADSPETQRMSKRRKGKEPAPQADEEEEAEDKKLGFRTNYESFNIYGWVLCLLVTRKGEKARARAAPSEPNRQVLMEEWMSTQAQGGDLGEE